MTEYNLAAVFITFILGVGKVALVSFSVYIPLQMFASALSFRRWL